jgi:NAD(P)H dehydrogenase (quinone)
MCSLLCFLFITGPLRRADDNAHAPHAQTFWDTTGKQWMSGGFYAKHAGMFVSTGTPGGGQESTFISAISTLAHHGIIYVPFGYARAFPSITNLEEVHGGSPWGAGCFAGPDGSRQPTALELGMATTQGQAFAELIKKHTQ